jgi:alpha-N-arabinofuranosidase
MQFMEPLGDTDGSVEAAWDFAKERWREDVVEVTRELAPGLIRWPGGCLSSYYRWHEGVGPRVKRKPMHNICWDGIESNQVGTHEFIDFCRQVGADPLIAVNFESDGRQHWARPTNWGVRSAGPKEAAAWVDYCNNPGNSTRRANGAPKPFDVRLWQIGNETSYDKRGFDCETSAKRTLAFARAMRKADPTIELIGWGDSGWAPRLLDIAGDALQYVAFHHHWGGRPEDAVFDQDEYRKSPATTWDALMCVHALLEDRIAELRKEVAGSAVKLAMTEGHFAVRGRNRGELLSTWGAGVADARVLNVQQRNGDILKIATLADFCGTRWSVNAIMIPVPAASCRKAFMMPVARVMSLYRRHGGKKACDVTVAPEDLDVTASRTGKKIFLHVVNTNRTESVRAALTMEGMNVVSGKVFQIADDPMREIHEYNSNLFAPTEHALPAGATWTFPAASVSAVELTVCE